MKLMIQSVICGIALSMSAVAFAATDQYACQAAWQNEAYYYGQIQTIQTQMNQCGADANCRYQCAQGLNWLMGQYSQAQNYRHQMCDN